VTCRSLKLTAGCLPLLPPSLPRSPSLTPPPPSPCSLDGGERGGHERHGERGRGRDERGQPGRPRGRGRAEPQLRGLSRPAITQHPQARPPAAAPTHGFKVGAHCGLLPWSVIMTMIVIMTMLVIAQS
jgi:hypothetical protein